MAKSSSETETAPPRRRCRWLKWLLRAVITVVVLLLLLIVVVQIVLMTGLPKSIVLSEVQKQFGLRATAKNVSVSWFGKTSLSDVQLSLPLAKESFVTVAEMRVKHTWLPGIILGYGPEIKEVELDHPILAVQQDTEGKWNLAEVMELVGRAGGKKQGEESAATAQPTAPPKLPKLAVIDALCQVTDNAGRSTKISPLNVRGEPDGPLVYRYEAGLQNHFTISGRVAPGQDWKHEVAVTVQKIDDIVRPWAPDLPRVVLGGTWTGQAGDGLTGRLKIDRLAVGDIAAAGILNVSTAGGVVAITPEQLLVKTDAEPTPGNGTSKPTTQPFTVGSSSGRLVYDGTKVSADKLVIAALGGFVRIDGAISPATQSGQMKAEWVELNYPTGLTQRGSIDFTLGKRIDGGPDIRAGIRSQGQKGIRSWNTQMQLTGAGGSWAETRWQLVAPEFKYKGIHEVRLDGLNIIANAKSGPGGTVVDVPTIQLPDTSHLRGQAHYESASSTWAVRLEGTNWPIPQLANTASNFQLDLSHDGAVLHLNQFLARIADVDILAKGHYDRRKPDPVAMDVDVTHHERKADPTDLSQIRQEQARLRNGDVPFIRGDLVSRIAVGGTLDPLDLKLVGRAKSSELMIGHRKLGELNVKLTGRATPDYVSLATDRLHALGGQWTLDAAYVNEEETLTANIAVTDLPLKEVADAASPGTQIAGTANGRWNLYVPLPGTDLNRIVLRGGLTLNGVQANGVAIDSMQIRTTLENGRVQVPIEASRTVPDAVKPGKLSTRIDMAAADLRRLDVKDLQLTDWPITVSPTEAVTLSVKSDGIALEMPAANPNDPTSGRPRAVSSSVHVAVWSKLAGKEAGQLDLEAKLVGRAADVTGISGSLFGSPIKGKLIVDYDHPLLMAGDLNITKIRSDRLAQFFPQAANVQGNFDVYASIKPVQGFTALEPMLLEVALDASPGATYNEIMEIGSGRFRTYLNVDPNWTLIRAVMEDEATPLIPPVERPGTIPTPVDRPYVPAMNTLHVGHGLVKVWGRVSRHDNEAGVKGNTSLSSHLRLAWAGLHLSEISKAGNPKADPIQGYVSGNVNLWGITTINPPADATRPTLVNAPRETMPPTPGTPLNDVPPGDPQPAPKTRPTTASATQPNQPSFFARLVGGMFGDGAIELQETNLGQVNAFAFLYNTMHVGKDADSPTGKGTATFRIEAGKMDAMLHNFTNKGIEARAMATVTNLQNFPNSPIEGHIVGSVRPLKDIKLPLFADVDKLMQAIETSTTSIKLEGTVRNVTPRIVTFGDLSEGMKTFLVGDVSSQTKGGAIQ